jgi:hypothetical protein
MKERDCYKCDHIDMLFIGGYQVTENGQAIYKCSLDPLHTGTELKPCECCPLDRKINYKGDK